MREPAREYQFLRIASKPFLQKFIQSIGAQSVEQIHDFVLKHPVGAKLHAKEGRIEVNDLYTILIYELLKEKNIPVPSLGNAAAEELRQFLYSKSV